MSVIQASKKNVSIVIPVYFAEESIGSLYEQLIETLVVIADQFEIIMVDDHSNDESWNIINGIVEHDSRVRGIRLSRNYGQHNALLCGIRKASYDTVITMDDDLQNPVSEISILLNKLDEGHDVVYGTPQQEQHGILRNLASRLTKIALQSAMGAETARSVSAFRAFKTKLRDGFQDYQSPFVSIDVLLTWSTSSFTSVAVRHEPRKVGISNYTLGKLVHHAFNLMTGFSTLPLQLASLVGFIFTLFGFIVLAFVVLRYFITGSTIPGFTFLASIIAIFSGAQLFALGIFGEYLARIHFRTMDRPPYVVNQIKGGPDDEPARLDTML
jgi:undecaprenyl-phosphate 4-deoxy-4-formamido-L-arabinose transferase